MQMLVMILISFFLTASGPIWAAPASDYPKKAVDLVVPFEAGGGTDVKARVYAKLLAEKWGKPVNVVNRPGGNTVIGTNYVMKAAPDGYTILKDGAGSCSLIMGMKDLPFKVEERTFIYGADNQPGVFIVSAESPWKHLKDVVSAAQKDPEKFTWASLGGGSSADLQMSLFFATTGIPVGKTRKVTFNGANPACVAIAGGHIQFGAAGANSALSLVRGGKLRAVAITSDKRIEQLADTATTAEQGFPKVNTIYWGGFSGPPGLPDPIVRVWVQTLEELHKDPKVIAQLAKLVIIPMNLGPAEFKKFALAEGEWVMKLWGK